MTSFYRLVLVLTLSLFATACAEAQLFAHFAKQWGEEGTGIYKVGKPYQIKGVWYYPKEDFEYDETGIASWYGPGFHRERTANGEIYDMNALTAAHRTLPLPSFVRVTNLDNGRTLVLRVNDRGPFARGRIIDVSRRGAELLEFRKNGTTRVRVQILAKESRQIAASYRAGKSLTAGETPITVASLPKAKVNSETLPPPPGGKASKPQKSRGLSSKSPKKPISRELGAVSDPATGEVSKAPVKETRLFVQAGAFKYYENANRVAAVLSKLGNVRISSVLVNGTDLFRVRLGPIDGVSSADRMLDRVIGSGYPDAGIVVD